MGTKQSFRRRNDIVRVDDEKRRGLVQSARNLVYSTGNDAVPVTSTKVERLLKSDSLTLTEVSMSQIHQFYIADLISKERFFQEASTIWV